MKYKYDAALPEGTSLDTVKAAMERLGFKWTQRIPAREQQLAEEIWLLPDGRGAVRYVYDHFVDVPSIRAESDVNGEPAKILVEIGKDLPLLHEGALTKQAKGTTADRPYAMRALAVIMPDYDGGVVAAYKNALKDDDPAIRRLALTTIARYPYFVFAKELEALAERESDPSIKKEAVRLAKDLREHGRRGTL